MNKVANSIVDVLLSMISQIAFLTVGLDVLFTYLDSALLLVTDPTWFQCLGMAFGLTVVVDSLFLDFQYLPLRKRNG